MLQDKSGRSQLKSCGSQIGIVLHGQEYKFHFWKLHAYPLGSIQTVQKRHADVDHDHVWLEPHSFPDECAPVSNCPYDVIALRQQQTKAISKDDVIVGDQYLWPGFHLSVSVRRSCW